MNIYTHNGIFLNNSETEQYYQIVTNAQNEQRQKHKKNNPNYVYYESHHILPRSIFPEFAKDKWNLVYLTAKEHLVCHQLLVKMIAKSKPYFQMVKAYNSMAYRKTKDMPRYELTFNEYAELRILCSEASADFARRPCTASTKAQISAANKGKKPSTTAIENSVKARTGKKKDSAAVHASATAQRGNTNVRGKTWWNNGVSNTLAFSCPDNSWVKGRTQFTDEHRKKISNSQLGNTKRKGKKLQRPV